MLCCSRAENSSTVILKSNMFSMIYNVWSWYDDKITQNYLLVIFLINIYSQDYKYTLKYSYEHYMVTVVSETILSVLQFLFCLQLFIFWLIITTLYFTSSNLKILIFWQCFLEDLFSSPGQVSYCHHFSSVVCRPFSVVRPSTFHI